MTIDTSRDVQIDRVPGEFGLLYRHGGVGVPLTLLHGSGPGVSGWSNFSENFPVFSDDFAALVPDLPGFGESDLPPLDRAYPKVAADAILRLLDHRGIEKTHLLGNSMGGYVALEFALAHPDRVDRLVLMGPGGLAASTFGPQQSEGALRLQEFMDNPTVAGMEAWLETMVARKDLFDWDELVARRMAAATPESIARAKTIFASLWEFPDPVPMFARVQDIVAPTLLTWGRDDRMLPYEQAIFGFRRMVNAELHVFPCGHWAQVEQKREFERIVIDFLTREAS